jgi:hypothetical protein
MTENVNRNLPPELSDDDAELLSAYLDNMLTAAEREALEKRLDSDAFLRVELQAMRRMVTWLNQMPDLKAPRNFTLSAEAIANEPPPNVVLLPRRNVWLSAAAAAVVIVLFGVVFVLSTLRQNEPGQPLESAGDAAQGAPQDEAEQVAGASSPTPMLTATVSTQNQTGFAATTVMGGATMPVVATFMPTMTVDQQGVDSATAGESDDATIVTEEEQEAESSTLAMAQANSADGMLTATVVMETGQTEIMAASVVQEETAQEAQMNDGLLTATVVMETSQAQTFALSTDTPDIIADTAIQAPAPMTATALPTQEALRSTGGAEDVPQPSGATGSTSALDNLRMTATAFVELYAQDSADSEIAAESSAADADADEKQSAFNVRQLFLYLWIRLLEYIGTAP